MLLLRWLIYWSVLLQSAGFLHSDDPYYRNIECDVTVEEWIYRNQSYPWLTLLALEDEVTHGIQNLIYAYQHPTDCKTQNFLVPESHNSGFGSSLHVLSEHFPTAIREQRIMVYDQTWLTWTKDVELCTEFQHNPDCYFEGISSCSEFVWRTRPPVKTHPNNWFQFMFDTAYGVEDISGWRAQWTKYIFKPRQVVLDLVRKFLEEHLVRLGPTDHKPERVSVNSHPPFNSIGMHIRHGDKESEMPLKGTHPVLGKFTALNNDNLQQISTNLSTLPRSW